MKGEAKILLVQIRDGDDPMAEHERACIARRMGVDRSLVEVRNAVVEPASPKWIDGSRAVIFGGSGSYSVHDPRSTPWVRDLRVLLEAVLKEGVPGFGICFGHQLLGHHLGGEVVTEPGFAEIGTVDVSLTDVGGRDPLMSSLQGTFSAHTGHSDSVTTIPDSVEVLASTGALHAQAFKVRGAPFYSTQFHPDMTGAEAKLRYLAYLEDFQAHNPEVVQRADSFVPGRDDATVLLDRFVAAALEG